MKQDTGSWLKPFPLQILRINQDIGTTGRRVLNSRFERHSSFIQASTKCRCIHHFPSKQKEELFNSRNFFLFHSKPHMLSAVFILFEV